MTYVLRITAKSNEYPFTTDHTKLAGPEPKTDDEAIEWADTMAKGLGTGYSVTLLRDGEVLLYDRRCWP